jgi:hypothetical protein
MDYFKFASYERDPVTLLRAYAENQAAFLQRLHPDVSLDTIKRFITTDVQKSLRRPALKMVAYPSYGNATLTTVDLLDYTATMRKNIITPAGVIYMPASVKESFLKRKLLDNMKVRKAQKKTMLVAQQAGDLVTKQRAEYQQASTKIETNSIPGAFGSEYNCLYDKPGYNAVTAMARHSIMCGYAHVEKMLEGNHYFPTLDHCINYCIQLARHCPADLTAVVTDYGLHTPSVDEVVEHFITSLRLYMGITPARRTALTRFIASFSIAERTFVFYAYCLKTLIGRNAQLFRPFLAEFFRTDIAVDPAVAPEAIFAFNGDLLALLSGLNADIIGRKTVAVAVQEEPDGIRQLIAIGRHMQAKLDTMGRLIATFLRVDCDVADAMSHPSMIRKAVIISDTDSVIFSTQHWVEWYTGGVSFDRDAYAINGFVVFLITMTLEQVFARLSTNFGAEGADVYRIAMKNEYLYPLMLNTYMPKQYSGRVAVQEGFVLPTMKEDTKGLSFRSSTMCRETVASGRTFRNWIFDTVLAGGELRAADCLEKVLDHELTVIRSLEAGERTFLTTKQIRNEGDYKKVEVSDYYYWKLWEEVFKPNFGTFVIPAKGYDIPLLGNGAVLRDERYLSRLRAFDPSLYERLLGFMDRNARAVTRLILPMTLKQIPLILRPVIDIRSIVYSNSTPHQVTMRSLGIAYTDSKDRTLLSDIYTKDGVECALMDSGGIVSDG